MMIKFKVYIEKALDGGKNVVVQEATSDDFSRYAGEFGEFASSFLPKSEPEPELADVPAEEALETVESVEGEPVVTKKGKAKK